MRFRSMFLLPNESNNNSVLRETFLPIVNGCMNKVTFMELCSITIFTYFITETI